MVRKLFRCRCSVFVWGVLRIQAHTNENLTIGGHFSVAKILQTHPLLEELLGQDEGLTWYVWKASIEFEYPKLPDLFQAGLNAKYSVQQAMDVWQVYARACSLWSSAAAKTKADPSVWILREIVRCNPKCSVADVEALVELSRKYGGGDEKLMAPLKIFLSTCKVPGRTVSTATLQAIAGLKMSPSVMCPQVIMSILMILASAPTQNFITSGEIKNMLSTEEKVEGVERMESTINEMNNVKDQMNTPADVAMKIVSNFRSKMALKFFVKDKKYKNITYTAIASEAFVELQRTSTLNVQNPFEGKESKGKGKGKGKGKNKGKRDGSDIDATLELVAMPAPSAIEYEDGKAIGLHLQIVKGKGFVLEGLVKNKETGG